jgi:hypothetical protein
MGIVSRDIISRLERDILPLEGLKLLSADNIINLGFRPIESAFLNAVFPSTQCLLAKACAHEGHCGI